MLSQSMYVIAGDRFIFSHDNLELTRKTSLVSSDFISSDSQATFKNRK